MPSGIRSFKRHRGERRYKKLYVISAEGKKTEPLYFAMFNSEHSVIHVECLNPKGGSSPDKVLKRVQDYIRNNSLKKTDEAWLVVDKDEWTDAQLSELYKWSKSKDNYGFALSNPKFEYWLLLHFEDGCGIGSSAQCSERLKRYLPDYDKGINPRKFTKDSITSAVSRAERRDNPPCDDWPRSTGTTVYHLVKALLGNRGSPELKT
jgi:hypothetical protein